MSAAHSKRWREKYPDRYKASSAKQRAKRDPKKRRYPCSAVRRAAQLRLLYGMSVEQYEAMEKTQGYCCAICGRPKHICSYEKLVVDHDHETNEVRALLCSQCNTILGLAAESPALLRQAADYLKKWIDRGTKA